MWKYNYSLQTILRKHFLFIYYYFFSPSLFCIPLRTSITKYIFDYHKKIDAIDRRVSEHIKKEKNTVKPNVMEQDSVSKVSIQKGTCMDVTRAKSQPLISVGVEFDTLLQNWERNGKERDMFVESWSEFQRYLSMARTILESVTNVNKTDDLPPEHGSV